jgi:hypothetical protein
VLNRRSPNPNGDSIMSTKITPRRQALIDAMRAALDSGEWERIEGRPGFSIRWDRWEPFPYHLADANGQIGSWSPLPEDNGRYEQNVFVTLATADSNPFLRVNRAPWIRSEDSGLTLTRAMAVLADPASALERTP